MGGHVAIVNVGCDVSKEFSTDGIDGSVEDHQIHRHIVGQKEITDGIHRYLQRLILRIVMHPRRSEEKPPFHNGCSGLVPESAVG